VGGSVVAKADLRGIRDKYAEMLSMRLADVEGVSDPLHARMRMQRLAERFPGALREIDDLPLHAIRARIEALDAVLAGARPVEPWMEAVALFHAFTRGALVAKRWLARRKHVDDGVRRQFEQALPELPFPEDSRGWAHDLESVASPPRGRLLDVVVTRLAVTLRQPEPAVRAMLFYAGASDPSR
jgi:hypothetical protein